MGLKVIGAGFGRTGTLSLKFALEKLGFDKCYHMMEIPLVPEHIPLWRAAAAGQSVDWESLFEGYQAAVDWPSCNFWRQQLQVFPEAKVILTRRDPEQWYSSVMHTIWLSSEQGRMDLADAEMTELNERKKGLLFKIPSNWNEIEKAYQAKVKVLTTAQRKYRRGMDDGYNGVVDAISVIKSGPKFEQIKPALFALRDKLVALPPKKAAELIKAESNALFADIAGVNAVKSLVGKARRLLKKEKAEKGMEQFDKALVQIEEEIAWRAVAVPAVLPVLQAFEDDVRMTIGLRSQDRLPDYLVPQIARCRSAHRNISLNF